MRTVVDVRLRPDRTWLDCWAKARTPDEGIETWLRAEGIEYQSLIELGNVFLDCPDSDARYVDLLAVAGPLLTARLTALPGPLCLLCAEKRFQKCHRRHIAEYMQKNFGAGIEHLV